MKTLPIVLAIVMVLVFSADRSDAREGKKDFYKGWVDVCSTC